MRVLMVTLELPREERPGTWAAVARQIDSIRARGIDVDIVEVKGPSKVKYVQAVPRLLARVADADVVHAHWGYCGWIARSQMRRPLVVSFMGSDVLGTADHLGRVTLTSRPVVAANRLLARLADGVIVKSQEMADVLRPIRAAVIPNGVDVALFRPIERRRAKLRLSWDPDARHVLFPGSIANPRKGYALARAAVDRAADELGSNLQLVPLSGISPDDVPLHMNGCDALLMTSHWEGSPNAVKEAMACDLPIVSVQVGDVGDLLSGVRECEIQPRDPRALGGALARVLTDALPSNGRAVLEEKRLDLASAAERIVDVYERVLVDGSSPRA